MTAKSGSAVAPTVPAPVGASDDEFALAGLLGAVAGAVPERTAVIAGKRRLSYADLDARATLLARHLCSAGISPGEHVAILSFNRTEWLESAFGVLRAGAVPVNVNYRYVARELRYVLDDADAVALIAERSLSGEVAEVRAELPKLRHAVLIDDGPARAHLPGADYEHALAQAGAEERPLLPPVGGDDRYLLYTGGTTGNPKGVVWRQSDIFRVALESRRPGVPRASSLAELGDRARACPPRRMLILGPLMHAAGQWNALCMLFSGKTVVLNTHRTFDAEFVLSLVEQEGVHTLQLIGDAMARPLAQRLLASPDRCADLVTVTSGGTSLTPAVRDLWRAWRPDVVLNDSYGGTETGVCGVLGGSGDGAPRFTMGAGVAVLDEELRPLPPGSEQVGRIARTGRIPLGYHNDPERTARTFPHDHEGRRWALSGDYGTVAEDGSVELLGRGSVVINTGGEKVYPEEVESVLKSHPDIDDTIVVPAPDQLLGQQVCAIVAPVPGRGPSDEQLRDHCRSRLAGFKIPRTFHVVERVRRTAVGKQDYRWARALVHQPP